MKKSTCRILSVLLFFFMMFQMPANPLMMQPDVVYAQPSGESIYDPIQISTVNELEKIAQNPNKHYILTANIDLSGNTGWTPIGTKSAPFTGSMDGDGYEIKNFTFETNQSNGGLFGYVKGASFKNIVMNNVNVKGKNNIGAIAGNVEGKTKVENCSVSGTVKGNDNVGGLIGLFSEKEGLIRRCFFEGTVEGQTYVGGLTGQIEFGYILYSYNKGEIRSSGYYAGGLTGCIIGTSSIKESFNHGTIKGSKYVGGITGYQLGISEITNSYNRGDISGTGSGVGGIAGYSKALIERCYSTGTINGSSSAGGIVGSVSSEANVSYSVAMNESINGKSIPGVGRVSGNDTGILSHNYAYENMALEVNHNPILVKATTPHHTDKNGENIKTIQFNTQEEFKDELNWDFGKVWQIPLKDYPILRSIKEEVQTADAKRGTVENPYLIYTEQDLKDITKNGLKYYYRVMSDIELSDTFWEPIGTSSDPFSGELDGNGFTIKNLNIQTTQEASGLFGVIRGASIKDLKIDACSVDGKDKTGGIAGYSYKGSRIVNCSVTGEISGANSVGGLVGYFTEGDGVIQNCDFDGTVQGVINVGGLAGYMNQTHMKNSSNQGEVSGTTQYIGGLVGQITNKATVKESFNLGKISGKNYVGGIAGYAWGNSEIADTYNQADISSTSSGAGGIAGYILSTITRSYSAGTITGSNAVGGIYGTRSASPSVTYCAVMGGSVSANTGEYVGRIGGRITNIVLENNVSYEDMKVESKGTELSIKETEPAHTSLHGCNIPLEQFYTKELYINELNWDFDNIWNMPGKKNEFPVFEKMEEDTEPAKVNVTNVLAFPETSEIYVGDILELHAEVVPENASNKNIIWSSSDDNIASVTAEGVVTGYNPGVATMTVTTEDGGYQTKCFVNVKEVKPKVNLALNKRAYSNSISGSNQPANAVDGNTSTRWTAKSNTSNVNLTIDFDGQVKVQQIKIKEHADRITQFVLQYHNGKGWVDFHSGTTVGDNFMLNTEPILCTQLRIVVASTKGVSGASIFEFEVYEEQAEEPEAIEITNLALDKTASASHTSGNYTAKKAVDGDASTRWTATSLSYGATLEVDFGEAVEFNQIILHEAYVRIGDFRLQYLDGENWIDCYKGNGVGTELAAEFESVRSKKVRLYVETLKGTNGAAIYEFEVYHR